MEYGGENLTYDEAGRILVWSKTEPSMDESSMIDEYAKGVCPSAFFGCQILDSVDLPNAEDIGDFAFQNSSISNFNLPSAMEIGQFAFANNTVAERIELSEAKTIGANAFADCTALRIVELPSAREIGMNAFGGCTSLEEVVLESITIEELMAIADDISLPDDCVVQCSDGEVRF